MPPIRPDQMIAAERVVPARYDLFVEGSGGASPGPEGAIPLAEWLALAEADAERELPGVILEGWDDLGPLEAHVGRATFVALHYPKFADGRCYSHARRIRGIWRYEGTILAFGDVLQDQIVYMWRSGVDTFYPREDQDLRRCSRAFRLFTRFYQYDAPSGGAA